MFENMIFVCVSIFTLLKHKMTKKRVKKDPRQRHPITFWRQVKGLHRESKNLEAISDELGVNIIRTAFFNNI